MLEEGTEMKNGKKLLVLSLVLLIMIGTCTFFLRNLLFGDVAGTYEQAVADRDQYKEVWVSYEVVACLGNYAEGSEYYGFIPTGHEYHYLVWMEDGSFMPLSVSKKADREYLDSLTNATYDYLEKKTSKIEVEPRTFTGTVKNLETKIKGFYSNALSKMNIKVTEDHKVYYDLMDCTSSRTSYCLLVGGVMLIPILGFVFAFSSIVKEKRRPKGEEIYLPK